MSFSSVIKRIFSKPDFVAGALVLGIAAAGMNFATDFLTLHFRKQAAPLRCANFDSADGIPSKLGKWVQVSPDTPVDLDMQHVLGTDKYLQRRYMDTEVVSAEAIRTLTALPGDQRERAINQVMGQHPEAVISLGIFYYTGFVDTVAHIPERCYLVDGFDLKSSEILHDQSIGVLADGSPRKVDFSYLGFEDISGRNRMPTNVAYLFHANGHYESSSLGVRANLQDLTEKYGYYAKIELNIAGTRADGSAAQNQQQALVAMKDFLASLLPEVERVMPDWKALHAPAAK